MLQIPGRIAVGSKSNIIIRKCVIYGNCKLWRLYSINEI